MLGKNNQDKLQKLSQDQTIKYKLRKKGKQWFNLTLTTTALGIGFFVLSTTTIHADVNPNPVVQQTQNNNASHDEQHSEHSEHGEPSEISHEQPKAQPMTTNQADNSDLHTGSSDEVNNQVVKKDNPASSSDDKQVSNTMSYDSKTSTPQVDNQNLKYPSANADTNHEKPDVVSANSKQDNSSSDDSKVINNNAAQPQPSVDDKDKVTAKDEITTQQSADKSKDMQDNQSPSDNASHSDNREIKVHDYNKQAFDNQKLVNGQTPNSQNNNQADQTNGGQVKDTDANHQPITNDDLAKASKDNNVSLLENKLSDQFAGGNHLKLAQMKLAVANNDSNNIPAPDQNGNYNWNSDQFAAAKAKNAVHSGVWGTAQWFIDKNNNLFVGNGEISNNHENYNTSPNYTYSTTTSTKDYYQYNGNYSNPEGYFYTNPNSMWGPTLDDDLGGQVSSSDIGSYVQYKYTENTPGCFKVEVQKVNHYVKGNRNYYNNQGLVNAIHNSIGNDDINISSINFTSSTNFPKDSSNLFDKSVSINQSSDEILTSTDTNIYLIGLPNGMGSLLNEHYKTLVSGNPSALPTNYYDKNTNYMNVQRITGYGNVNTSQVENMHNLFGGQAVNPDTSSWDTHNVQDMSDMMSGTHETNLDLSKNDLSKVTDFSNMANTPTLRTANLNNDTISDSSNKANMLNGNVQEVSFNSKDTL
ncbi:BspA family leucine-rich repeat surface protein [Apilactobacillus micheneri]|uniref:BspA family leucine-rich repeat surface protein n=1 Tax=Apilactobacillus micheneri TaxID=1899430 RepID=UPI00112D7211|nr:BspA family leucine-rich repeat surface protein [Apilactobacillus micheneri]TPR49266.1 BspA family leucine-rich repeat surface protein [Apilactobacillus micheneri]